MSDEIEDTLPAEEDSSSSDPPANSPSSSPRETEIAATLVASAKSDPALDQTVGALESKSTWIPLTLQKAQLATVSRANYEVHRELARGGMGRILSARDSRLGRPVAIKELLRGGATARARFEREAIITARLQHPAIVPLYEAGHWPNGEPFFAMKMVAGDPLDQVARECKTLDERVGLVGRVIDVADALAYAHSKDVIHRDLKPANVLVGDFGETVVIDWGLAKSLGDEDEFADEEDEEANETSLHGESEKLTVLGQAMGTPAYMAPEQARGEMVDKRADVYSLGAILYHVLSGDMAYAGSKSADEVLSKVLQGPPKPLALITTGLAPPLVTIVNKAMARDREDRYQDASILADELRRYQAGQLVNAHAYSLQALVTRWVQGHKALVASVGAIFVVAAVAALLSYRSIRHERDLAMDARNQANESAKLAEKEKTKARHKSVELGLTLAFSLAEEQPLEALQEIDGLEGLGQFPELIARARVIAGQARSHRVTTELTERGIRHGQFVLSPDDAEVAVAWNRVEVGLINLESRTIKMLPEIKLESVDLLRYTADGLHLVVATKSSAGKVVVWQRERAEIVATLEVESGLQAMEVSPDGRWLALRRFGRILLYDLSTGSEVAQSQRRLVARGGNGFEFSPDSKSLALLSSDLHLYDLQTHTETMLLRGEADPRVAIGRSGYQNVIYSPDSKKLVLATTQVSILDIASRELTKLFVTTQGVKSLAVSADGKTIVAGASDQLIYVYDVGKKSSPLMTLNGHDQDVIMVAFTGEENELISAGNKGQLRLWNIGSSLGRSYYEGQIPEVLTDRLREDQLPIVSSDQSKIVAYDRFGALRSWARLRPDVEVLGPVHIYSRATFAIGQNRLVWTAGGLNHSIHIFDKSGERRVLGSHGEQIELIAISEDDRYVASGGKTVRLWDLKLGTSRELEGPTDYMRHLTFVGQTLFAADLSGSIYRFELASGKGERVAEHGDLLLGMVGVVVDPKGRWVATAGIRRKVFLHDLATGKKRLVSEGPKVARGLAASQGGELLAFSSGDSEVTVVTALEDSEAIVVRSPETREDLAFPAFSPDGRSLVVSSEHLGLRIWPDWRNQPDATRVLTSRGESTFPVFSPDGRLVVAPGDHAGFTSIWDVATGQRRELKGQSINTKAEFWPEGSRVVVANVSGVVALWLDDLPHDWASLQAWIRGQIAAHEMKRK